MTTENERAYCAEQERRGLLDHEPLPADRTLLELVDAAISGAWAHAAGDIDPVDVRAEIARRLELINRYGGTEASNIKAILATGRPLDGWISDPPQHPAGTPEHAAYAAELKTELAKFAKGEEPYPYLGGDA